MKKYKRPIYHEENIDGLCGKLACYFLSPEGEDPKRAEDVVYSDGSHPKHGEHCGDEFLTCQACGHVLGINTVAPCGTPTAKLWSF